MELSEYLQDLRIALAAIGVKDDAAERVIDRESCTLSGVSDKHQKEYVTRARLEMVISSEKARLQRSWNAQNQTSNSDKIPEFKKNNVTQDSCDATTVQDIGQKTVIPENTISIARLPSDTRTIIISEQPEDKTLPLFLKKQEPLRETNLTVRISEKTFPDTPPDTKDSEPAENNTILITPPTETTGAAEESKKAKKTSGFPINQESILSADPDTILIPVIEETKKGSEQDTLSRTSPIPPLEKISSHQEDKKTTGKDSMSTVPKNESNPEIKNAHPIFLGFWLFLLFLPSLFFVFLFLLVVFFTVNLVLLLALALVTGFYFCFLLFLLSASLYSLLFVIRYSGAGRINDALTEAGLMLLCSGTALSGGYFLYRPILSCITFLRRIGEGFNKKFFLLVRNLLRYAKKGVGIL